jgi:hypothetical protein
MKPAGRARGCESMSEGALEDRAESGQRQLPPAADIRLGCLKPAMVESRMGAVAWAMRQRSEIADEPNQMEFVSDLIRYIEDNKRAVKG